MINLVENAIKFSDPGTEILLEIKDRTDSALVAVKDQGIGISHKNLEVIFEKFRTLPSSKSGANGEGTGLGLAICKGIIEGHGGQIWAESSKNRGSSFYISVPKSRK